MKGLQETNSVTASKWNGKFGAVIFNLEREGKKLEMRFVKSLLGVTIRQGMRNEGSERSRPQSRDYVWEVKKDKLYLKYNVNFVGCNTDYWQNQHIDVIRKGRKTSTYKIYQQKTVLKFLKT